MLGMPLDLGVLLFHQEWNEGQHPEIAEYNHYRAIRAGLGRWRCRRWWCLRWWWCRWRTRGAGGLIVFHFSLSSIDKEAFSTLMGSILPNTAKGDKQALSPHPMAKVTSRRWAIRDPSLARTPPTKNRWDSLSTRLPDRVKGCCCAFPIDGCSSPAKPCRICTGKL